MRSYQIVAWGEPLERREYPTPEPQGTEVLVRVEACGVCHSDLHIWDGYFDMGDGQRITLADRGVDLPFTMGHEIVGEVVAVGPEAVGAAEGDKRVVFPWIGCGSCDVCLRGDELLCTRPKYLGTRAHGGYSDYVMVPDPKYLVDYSGVPTNLACTYACAGLTAYSALKKVAPLAKDDHFIVIGAGGVGLSAVHIAPAVVDAKMIVADVDGEKRSAARQAGAAETIDNGEDGAVSRILKMTGGGVAAAIDFVGVPATTKFGIDVLRKGGSHVVVGLHGGALPISLPLFPFKMMSVRGSFVGSLEELRELMDLVKAGKIPPIPIEPRPMSETNRTLNDLREGRVLGRVVLTP